MNLKLLFAALAVALIAYPATAQPVSRTTDCSKARDPARCEARLTATETCKEKRGAAGKQCIEDRLPPPDCDKAGNPEKCAAAVAARAACRGKIGPERRQCLRGQTKPAAPRK